MDPGLVVILLVTLLLASYWQAVTGFAMGMIAVAVIGGLRLLDIPVTTAVVSLLSLFNACFALKGATVHLNRAMALRIAAGQLPAIVVGVWLLTVLDANATWLLELLLGLFITFGSLSMWLRPEPLTQISGTPGTVAAGVAGGLVGGLFSASGPVLGWFAYRQPLPLAEIRATLLACFVFTTSTRTLAVGAGGGLTGEVLAYTALGLPVVAFGTWAGRVWPPAVSERTLRRTAFAGLVLMGVWISATALARAT